jgi:hypothetical protein
VTTAALRQAQENWGTGMGRGAALRSGAAHYLGTNTSFIGILVTMSAHEQVNEEYAGRLEEMMNTVTVYQR